VLGGARTAVLTEHPIDGAVAGTPVRDRTDGIHQVE
jgi:hypothetical protein